MITAETYLNEFASDRRHMRRPDDTWIKPPPPYPPIATSSEYQPHKNDTIGSKATAIYYLLPPNLISEPENDKKTRPLLVWHAINDLN